MSDAISDEIKPAMTDEEWRRIKGTHFVGNFLKQIADDSERTQSANQLSRHAVAAVALRGQPFGFTRQDLVDLRSGAVLALREGGCDLVADAVERIAARIEALLPPE